MEILFKIVVWTLNWVFYGRFYGPLSHVLVVMALGCLGPPLNPPQVRLS